MKFFGPSHNPTHRLIRTLTINCWVALILLALLAVGNYLLLKKEIQVNAASSIVLNVSGRQHTMAQRALLLVEHLFIAQEPLKKEDLRQELEAIAGRLEISHHSLLYGNPSMDLPGHPSEAVGKIFYGPAYSLDVRLQGFTNALRSLIETPDSQLTLNDPNLRYLLAPENSEKLLEGFNALGAQYQREADENIARLRRSAIWILIITLFLLAATGFFIFLPMVKSVRREMEKSRLEEERLHLLLSEMPAILWTTDRDMKITMQVGAALANLGLRPNQYNGVSMYDYLQTRDSEFAPIAAHRRALKGESNGYNMEWQGRWFQSYVEPLKGEYEKIAGVIGVALDVTEQRRVEQDFKKSISLLQATLESTADGILVVDTAGKIVRFNRKFVEMWRIPDDILASRDDNRAIAYVLDQLDDPEGFLEKVRALYEAPDAGSYDILQFKDGRIFERFSQPQRLGEKVVGRVWSFRDVTEARKSAENLKKANEDLIRLNKVKSEFTSMVSHELRTPLSSIKESIHLVLDGVDGPVTDGQAETLEIAKRNVDRLARLIDNVLDFSRLESGKMLMNFVATNLNELFHEVYQLMKASVLKKKVDFTVDLPSAPVVATCDPDNIRQVMINLIDNALKFTSAPGRVAVRLRREGNKVLAEVEDTGAGISSEDLPKIFEMFAQVRAPGRGKPGGAGIGLALCRQIIKQHGGEISVTSQPGKGSCFRVVFPG